MIDIHCHILPNLDDGPEDLDAALKMAKVAEKDGIDTIIATPHCCNGVYNNVINDISQACAILNGALVAKKIKVRILPGAEVRLTPELIDNHANGHLMTMADSLRYLLVELPQMFIVESVINVLEQLREKGIQVIIAHPERNMAILNNINAVNLLAYSGASMQLTADSLTGKYGPEIARAAEVIVSMDGTHFVASDAHDARVRRPVLSKAIKKLKKIVGSSRTDEIVYENPQLIIERPVSVAMQAGA